MPAPLMVINPTLVSSLDSRDERRRPPLPKPTSADRYLICSKAVDRCAFCPTDWAAGHQMAVGRGSPEVVPRPQPDMTHEPPVRLKAVTFPRRLSLSGLSIFDNVEMDFVHEGA